MKYVEAKINLSYGKDIKYFRILFEALIRVSNQYLHYSISNISDKNVFEEQEQVERVFAYELYRQWANLLDELHVKNVVLNGETAKMLKSVEIRCEYRLVSGVKKYKTIFPDLVLHSSQGNNMKQKIICEIKRNGSLTAQNLYADLFKLCCYMDTKSYDKDKGQNAFKYGVFILVDGNLNTIKEKINSNPIIWYNGKKKEWNSFRKSKMYKDKCNKIVCVAYNGKVLEYETLENCLI